MKKNVLFIINNLNCGGAEKALISLLNTIDYSIFNVDLYLFQHEGLFFSKIPSQVTLLNEPPEYKYFDTSIVKAINDSLKNNRLDIAFARAQAGLIFKTEKNGARCEQKVWRYLSKTLSQLEKEYDIAIGYLEKNPIYFCVDKVKAKRKIGFIHNDYNMLGMDPNIDLKYFEKLDKIVTVSKECASVLKQSFPKYQEKFEVMYNIVSPGLIHKMSKEKVEIKREGTRIVSIGRLTYQKGFELAIEACKHLVETGFEITWYVIGEGEERFKLEKLIAENHLKERFILLGIQENPYPYLREADIYVQPSRFEGKSIAIDEAKIMKKPIVLTNFTTAKDQIESEKNGLIVEMNSMAISEGIKKLLDNDDFRKNLVSYLSQEKMGTEEEINKLYDLFKVG